MKKKLDRWHKHAGLRPDNSHPSSHARGQGSSCGASAEYRSYGWWWRFALRVLVMEAFSVNFSIALHNRDK